jgi:quercetin dioxygenase-like cupin family protein
MNDFITHHFGGGVYAKETHIPAGLILVQHKHAHDHLSYLVKGVVEVSVDGIPRTVAAPACLTIEAVKHHGVKALVDSIWLCIHASDCTDEQEVDKVLIMNPDHAQMASIIEEMR